MAKTQIQDQDLSSENAGQSLKEAFSTYLKMKKKNFSFSIRFISFLKVFSIFYSVLLSYCVSSTVELAALTGFSNVLVQNIMTCLFIVCGQYVLGAIKGDESLKLGSKMDRGLVENVSQLSLYSNVTLTPRFVSFAKELRMARSEYIPEFVTTLVGIVAFLVYSSLKGAFVVFLPMLIVFVLFILITYLRRYKDASVWDIQERLLKRGFNALDEAEAESIEPSISTKSNSTDVRNFFRLKLVGFKVDFVTKGLIILAAINAALVFSSSHHPDRIVLSTLGLFAAKMLQDAVPTWIDILRISEIARSIKWSRLERPRSSEANHHFDGSLSFSNVHFRYNENAPWILSDISFNIRPGETLVISGRSGAGKSSFLKMITGELRPSLGSVNYSGINSIESGDVFFKSAGHASYSATFPNIKINVLFSWFESYQLRKSFVLDCLEIHPRTLDLNYSTLSQGEKKKISIAVALFQANKIVVLDEPYSGFDQNYRARLAAKLAELEMTKVITITENKDLSFRII